MIIGTIRAIGTAVVVALQAGDAVITAAKRLTRMRRPKPVAGQSHKTTDHIEAQIAAGARAFPPPRKSRR